MIETSLETTFPPQDIASSFHLTSKQIQAGMQGVLQSPKDKGTVEMLVIRTEREKRSVPNQMILSPEDGVHGDRWSEGSWKKKPDGSPHPDTQVTLTNARFIDLISQTKQQWSWAGDNLLVDLDLSEGNLQPGVQLLIGEVILEVSAAPHNGCKKYAQRYGKDAIRFINSPQGKQLHLRGIYAKVVRAGVIKVGDSIAKI